MGIYIWIFVELYRAFFKKHYGIDTFYTDVKVNLLNTKKNRSTKFGIKFRPGEGEENKRKP